MAPTPLATGTVVAKGDAMLTRTEPKSSDRTHIASTDPASSSAERVRYTRSDCHFGIGTGALLALGVLLSGPVGILTVTLFAPQPTWQSAELFVQHYHPLQLLPYAFGFALIAGCAATVIALIEEGRQRQRDRLALVCVGAFAALIILNYIVQTTFVPGLVAHYRSELGPFVEALSMSNPRSLGWALEMWGYALLGLAMWLVAPTLSDTRLERLTARLFVLNAIMSIAGGLATAYRIDWVFATSGLVSFGLWNVLMLVLGVLVVFVWHRRLRAIALSAPG